MTNGQPDEDEEISLDEEIENPKENKTQTNNEPKYYECDDDYFCFELKFSN